MSDLARDRQFWRDGRHLIGELLSWVGDEGFEEFFGSDGELARRHPAFRGLDERTAHEWRQRHLIAAVSAATIVKR